MRLRSDQINVIKQDTAHYSDERAEVWLFGSREDDTAKGDDVDLFVNDATSNVGKLATERYAHG